MAKYTPREARINVERTVEKHANHNIPRLGAIKLGIQQFIADRISGFTDKSLKVSGFFHELKDRRLEKQKEAAQRKYDRKFAWANGAKNQRIKEKRLADPKLKNLEENLLGIKEKIEAHDANRRGRIAAANTEKSERQAAIDRNREGLKGKKQSALVNRELRHLKKELRRNGDYSRSEVADIINGVSGEQKQALGEQLQQQIALKAAERGNERGLRIAEYRVESTKREIERVRNRRKASEESARDTRTDILSEMGPGVTTFTLNDVYNMADLIRSGAIPTPAGALPDFRAASLEELGEEYFSKLEEIKELKRRDRVLVRRLRETRTSRDDTEHNHNMAKAVLDAKLGAVTYQLARLRIEIKEG